MNVACDQEQLTREERRKQRYAKWEAAERYWKDKEEEQKQYCEFDKDSYFFIAQS
jgi:hypothetical protein